MQFILKIFGWILIIAFFPLSLLFVAYFRERRINKSFYRSQQKERANGDKEERIE